MNLPNLLSMIRIILSPIVFVLILNVSDHNYLVLIFLYMFTVMLDFFDGYLARRLCQETELGKILDPLADKLLTILVILALIVKADFPLWLAVPIFSRDAAILLASFLIYRKKSQVHPSIFVGKVTFFILSFIIFIYIIDFSPGINLHIYKRFFSVATLSFLLWSFLEYFKIYERVKHDG